MKTPPEPHEEKCKIKTQFIIKIHDKYTVCNKIHNK